MKKCEFKHEFTRVGNRYKNGKVVVKGGEWKVETKCKKCGYIFEVSSHNT